MEKHVQIGEFMRSSPNAVTRQDIAEALGESVDTVTKLLRRMLAACIVYDTGATRPVDGRDEALWRIRRDADLTQPLASARLVTKAEVRKKHSKAKKSDPKAIEERAEIVTHFIEAIKEIAERKLYFTIDDAREVFDTRGHSFGKHDPRLSSSAVHQATKKGYCVKAKENEGVLTSIKSERRGGGLTRLYRSLICVDAAIPEEAEPTVDRETVLLRELAKLREENAKLREELAWRARQQASASAPQQGAGEAH